MKLVKTLFGVLFATALFTVSAIGATNAVASATSTSSDLWKLTLAGQSVIQTQSPGDASAGLTFGLSRNVVEFAPAEIGVRQSIGWANGPDKNAGSWVLSTTVFDDWRVIKVGNFELLAGVRVGPTYGNTQLTWAGGPESEQRLWLKKDVFAFVREGYDFAFSDSGLKSKDSLGLTIGLGFSW